MSFIIATPRRIVIVTFLAIFAAGLIALGAYSIDTAEITNMTNEECRDIAIEAGNLACGDYRDCQDVTQNAYDRCFIDIQKELVQEECDDAECGDGPFFKVPEQKPFEELPIIECPEGLSCPPPELTDLDD